MVGRWAVQLEPIKPVLTAHGPMLLKLRYDQPLSNLAFNFNLRRYTMDCTSDTAMYRLELSQELLSRTHLRDVAGYQAGAYTRSHFRST